MYRLGGRGGADVETRLIWCITSCQEPNCVYVPVMPRDWRRRPSCLLRLSSPRLCIFADVSPGGVVSWHGPHWFCHVKGVLRRVAYVLALKSPLLPMPVPVWQASRRVMAIGRRDQGRGQRWDGIECGALVLSTEIFDSLDTLCKRRRYFTLADGLDMLAGESGILSVTMITGMRQLGIFLSACEHSSARARSTRLPSSGHSPRPRW